MTSNSSRREALFTVAISHACHASGVRYLEKGIAFGSHISAVYFLAFANTLYDSNGQANIFLVIDLSCERHINIIGSERDRERSTQILAVKGE